MQPGLLIRLRPLGAWRYGPPDGGHDRVDTLFRSDRLYSAVTLAFGRLGLLDEWVAATAHATTPAVTFSSLFPYQAETLYAAPPAHLWPPPLQLLHSPSPVFLTKIRWKIARFVPLSVIDSLITGQPLLADQWLPDAESGCLLRRDRPSASPFRVVMRSGAAVDRLTRTSAESNALACVEFEPSAGLWAVARFADEAAEKEWSPKLQAAIRLLSDSGFGGGRTKGWGQTDKPEFNSGAWPALLLPKLGRLLRNAAPATAPEQGSALFWLLSLYSPAANDKIDWAGGHYSLSSRGGRVESPAGSGAAKKTVRMVNEGCVLSCQHEPVGAAVDVAPDGFAHPVFRSGLALALRLPVVEIQQPEPVPPAAEVETAPDVVSESVPEPAQLHEEIPPEPEVAAAPVVEPEPAPVEEPVVTPHPQAEPEPVPHDEQPKQHDSQPHEEEPPHEI